jgi:hypothetical protein
MNGAIVTLMEGWQQYQGCSAVVGAMAVVAVVARQWRPNNQQKWARTTVAVAAAATVAAAGNHPSLWRQWAEDGKTKGRMTRATICCGSRAFASMGPS